MSVLYNLTRNEESTIGKTLDTEDDFIEVWKFARTNGYAPLLQADPDTGDIRLSVTAPGGNTSMLANVGDWAVLRNNAVLTLIPAALGPSIYTVGAPV